MYIICNYITNSILNYTKKKHTPYTNFQLEKQKWWMYIQEQALYLKQVHFQITKASDTMTLSLLEAPESHTKISSTCTCRSLIRTYTNTVGEEEEIAYYPVFVGEDCFLYGVNKLIDGRWWHAEPIGSDLHAPSILFNPKELDMSIFSPVCLGTFEQSLIMCRFYVTWESVTARLCYMYK